MSKGSRDLDYLDHIADRIRRIERVTVGVDLAGFLGNEDLQALIERHIEVIGEAAGKLESASTRVGVGCSVGTGDRRTERDHPWLCGDRPEADMGHGEGSCARIAHRDRSFAECSSPGSQ